MAAKSLDLQGLSIYDQQIKSFILNLIQNVTDRILPIEEFVDRLTQIVDNYSITNGDNIGDYLTIDDIQTETRIITRLTLKQLHVLDANAESIGVATIEDLYRIYLALGLNENFTAEWDGEFPDGTTIVDAIKLKNQEIGTYVHYTDGTHKWDYQTVLDANSGFKDDPNIDFVILAPFITELKKNTFSGCSGLTTVIFPSSPLYTSIEESVFRNTSALVAIDIPANIYRIKRNAFLGSGIKSVRIGNQEVKEIGEKAFSGCSNLTSIEIHGSGSLELQNETFGDCSALKKVILTGISQLNQYTFKNSKAIGYISITDSNVETRYGQFQNCTALKTAILTGVNRLAERTFEGCTSLKTVELSELMIEMHYYSFYGCSALTELRVPKTNNNNNNRIKNHAIENSGIRKLILENPNEEFEDWSFDYNQRTSMTIYSYLDSRVQSKAAQLNIAFKALLPDTMTDTLENSALPVSARAVLNGISSNSKVYVVNYNSPNFSEAREAYNNGRVLLVYYSSNNNWYIAYYCDSSTIYFKCLTDIYLSFAPTSQNISYGINVLYLYSYNSWSSTSTTTSYSNEIFCCTYNSTNYSTINSLYSNKTHLYVQKDNQRYYLQEYKNNTFYFVGDIKIITNGTTKEISYTEITINSSNQWSTNTYTMSNYHDEIETLKTEVNNAFETVTRAIIDLRNSLNLIAENNII